MGEGAARPPLFTGWFGCLAWLWLGFGLSLAWLGFAKAGGGHGGGRTFSESSGGIC